MVRFKMSIALILAVLVFVVVFQNTDTVETRLLFATVAMPRAMLLLGTLLIGFVLGLMVSFGFFKKPSK